MYYDNRTRDFVVDFWNDINHIHTTTLYFKDLCHLYKYTTKETVKNYIQQFNTKAGILLKRVKGKHFNLLWMCPEYSKNPK